MRMRDICKLRTGGGERLSQAGRRLSTINSWKVETRADSQLSPVVPPSSLTPD